MRNSLGPLLRRAMVGVLCPRRALRHRAAPRRPRRPPPRRRASPSPSGTARSSTAESSGRPTRPSAAGRPSSGRRRPAPPHARAGQRGGATATSTCSTSTSTTTRTPTTPAAREVRLPAGARVTYARLYWGGNLRVGEQKPPKDNGRVLIAEPGGEYKAVLADTVVGHRVARRRRRVPGLGGRHPAGARERRRACTPWRRSMWRWATPRPGPGAAGRWWWRTRRQSEPLRHLALWDGFDSLDAGAGPDGPAARAAVPAGRRRACGPGRVQRRPRRPGRLADRVDRARPADRAGRRRQPP